MDAQFWHERWAEGRIGFHQGAVNALLVAHIGALGLAAGARVFLPLCGKTRDIAWLRARGHAVAGAELSRLAVEQLFEEMSVVPEVTAAGPMERFRGEGVEIFVGDIVELTADMLGPVAAVYDRAALIALPEGLRARYGAHLGAITGGAPQLVIGFEYDQTLREGPPFSVDGIELARVYPDRRLRELARVEVAGGLGGEVSAQEVAWLVE